MTKFFKRLLLAIIFLFAVLVLLLFSAAFYVNTFSLDGDYYELTSSGGEYVLTRVRPSRAKRVDKKLKLNGEELSISFSDARKIGSLYCFEKDRKEKKSPDSKSYPESVKIKYSLFSSYIISCESRYIQKPEWLSYDQAKKSGEYGYFDFIGVDYQLFGGLVNRSFSELIKIDKYFTDSEKYGFRNNFKITLQKLNEDKYMDVKLTKYYTKRISEKKTVDTVETQKLIWSYKENKFIAKPVVISTKEHKH